MLFQYNTISVLPPPGTNSFSRTKDLNTLTPSSIALSTSSRIFLVLPLRIIVLNLQSSVFLLNTTNFSEATSSTMISSHSPVSSGVGAYNLERIIALMARATLLSSNLLMILTVMILYLSKKCKTISEMDPPVTTTLILALTNFCTNF